MQSLTLHLESLGARSEAVCWAEQARLLCREIFDQLDTDKSGGVSIEELSTGLVEMGYLVSHVRACSAAHITRPVLVDCHLVQLSSLPLPLQHSCCSAVRQRPAAVISTKK